MFWAGFGTGLLTTAGLVTAGVPGSAVGMGGAVGLGVSGPKPARLAASAPQPQLLRDADYQQGYARGARGKKMGRVALGWGVGTVASLGTLLVMVLVALSGGFS
jgi:hypothetical protein